MRTKQKLRMILTCPCISNVILNITTHNVRTTLKILLHLYQFWAKDTLFYGICYLTELCLCCTYFIFQGQIFKQLKGTAIGSPLPPVVANIFMEDFETMALMTVDYQPTIWKRDTFMIWPHGREKLEYFLQHTNTLHKDITFTVEVEDHKIAFLDVQITRNNNTLETLVYQHTLTVSQF